MGLKWSINGKYFKFFGVRVSNSKGLIDKLKPRERQSYVWAEYHGKQIDLSAPRYEARDMVLSCWIVADNAEALTKQYNSFMAEFDKSGTQRFLVEPFGKAPYIYDVILTDKSELDKEFCDGEMFGTFNITIQEPNPIKRVLYTVNPQLTISYNSPTETDIIIDGVKYQGKELVNFTKDLGSRDVVGSTGNLLINSSCLGGKHPATNLYNSEIVIQNDGVFPTVKSFYSVAIQGTGDFKMPYVEAGRYLFLRNKQITLSFYARSNYPPSSYRVTNQLTDDSWNIGTSGNGDKNGKKLTTTWQRFEITCIPVWGIVFEASNLVSFSAPQVELGNKSTAWSVAENDKHYIVIAGNIEDITNFTTNAEVLWEKI